MRFVALTASSRFQDLDAFASTVRDVDSVMLLQNPAPISMTYRGIKPIG